MAKVTTEMVQRLINGEVLREGGAVLQWSGDPPPGMKATPNADEVIVADAIHDRHEAKEAAVSAVYEDDEAEDETE